MSGNQTFELSYYDEDDVEVCKVIVRYIAVEQIEKWYVQINTDDSEPILIDERENPDKMLHPFFRATIMDYSYADLITPIEKKIKKIITTKF